MASERLPMNLFCKQSTKSSRKDSVDDDAAVAIGHTGTRNWRSRGRLGAV